jgi:hypothetical protein
MEGAVRPRCFLYIHERTNNSCLGFVFSQSNQGIFGYAGRFSNWSSIMVIRIRGWYILWMIIFHYHCSGLKGTVQRDGFGWKWYQLICLPYRDRRRDFLADFARPLSYERPFKCLHHLIQDLGYDKLFPITIHTHTSSSGFFFNPILMFPIPLT